MERTELEMVEWSDHLRLMEWEQGEHVTIIGPTGQGKTTLALALAPLRGWVAVFATKPRDRVLDALNRDHGYRIIREWPPPTFDQRVIFWPRPPRDEPDNIKPQADAIRDALRMIYESGRWTVVFDELRHVTDFLNQKRMVELFWQQGRSLGISVVACTQRPTHVPLLAYDQATHLYLYGDRDETNIRRMGGLGWWSKGEIMRAISTLDRHDLLYLNTRNGVMHKTRLPESEVIA